MRVKVIINGLLLVILMVGCAYPLPANEQPPSSTSASRGSSKELFLPQFDRPLPSAERVSLAEAQARVPYKIPLPEAAEIQKVWASPTAVDQADRSVAVRFSDGLLLVAHPMAQPPDWDSIIATAPLFKKITVDGNPGIGVTPGTTEVRGKAHPYPGSVEWWVDGLDLTLYSESMSLETLLDLAESLR